MSIAQIQWQFSENGLLSVSDFLKMITYFQFRFSEKLTGWTCRNAVLYGNQDVNNTPSSILPQSKNTKFFT